MNVRRLLSLLTSGAILLGCSSVEEEELIDKRLLAFKTEYVCEPMEEEEFAKEIGYADNKTLKVEYLEDVIYVRAWSTVNACGSYYGNIVVSNDTIQLLCKLKPGDLCSSQSIEKLTYFINNPEKKKWVIVN